MIIGLCMIVRNEAKVILRCLDSVRPLLDYVLIEDTGSTDGTQDIIREWLVREKLPGEIVEEPWRDFAYNRTHVLAKLRERPAVDYAFMIDADDRVQIDGDIETFKKNMVADFYDVEIHHGSVMHHRPQIYRNALNFSYRGVVHEFVDVPNGGLTRATATGFHIEIVGGGARSQNAAKFQHDAEMLEHALKTEKDPFMISRYTFYLAQSYRDCGEKEKALSYYLTRTGLGFWDEEVYMALCESAALLAPLGCPPEIVLTTLERAMERVPGRAEAFYHASHYCRSVGRNEEGYQIAKRALALVDVPNGLFVQPWIYQYGLLDEYAVNAYWAGHYRECADACEQILKGDTIPEDVRGRIETNARLAKERLVPGVLVFECCPACAFTETLSVRPDLGAHPYVACGQCGLFYQSNMRPKVFEAHHEIRGDQMSEADRAANRHLAAALYHNHLARTFGSEPLLHLDIGSKYPFFGYCLQETAVENNASLISHGIDGIAEAREFGEQLGVSMIVGDFEADPQTWDIPKGATSKEYHCVTLVHCFEHFYNPAEVLRKIRGLLADDGILFIRSPDSAVPGIERDFTPGHYDIHPTIWCESAMRKAISGLFEIYETYTLQPGQRDYLMRPVNEKKIVNILRPGAIGDVLASSAVTAQLSGEVRYYTKIPEMANLLTGVHRVFDAGDWDRRAPGRDLILTGYPIREGYPEQPMRKHLVEYFCDEAGVFCGLPRLKDALEPFEMLHGCWITIHPKTGWSVYKDWGLDKWNEIVRCLRSDYPDIAIVQIGGENDPRLDEADYDLRGRTSISQALWLIKNSVLHLGGDSFSNHAAGAFEHPAVIVFGSTSPTGSGYPTATNLWAALPCSPCYREDPAISRQSRGPCINPPGQEYNAPRHACMAAVSVEMVWDAIEELLAKADIKTGRVTA